MIPKTINVEESVTTRKIALYAVGLLALTLIAVFPEHVRSLTSTEEREKTDRFAGSVSCRKCHEKFYQLWSTSHHGLAMQPYTEEFAARALTPQENVIPVGSHQYRAEIGKQGGYIVERGPEGEKNYPIEHAMGGKNVYYFLTTLERGRLQTLPLAYDVRKKEWFDMAASGLRHFPGGNERSVHWKEWPYTFNTSCYSCHVSQLSTNYDPKTDAYGTSWREPGINCETCHGPSEEHNRVCEAAPKGTVPQDLKIMRGGRSFTKDQNNATCSSCHAKAVVLTDTFSPGGKFFDHFDLVTLESADYYPDGRDLGENYTYTSWIMSPCVKSGKLDCLHCHTSSGRYKFKNPEKANGACMPCHRERVENAPAHTHHKPGTLGNECIACHMPASEFARMRRSDHSMLPPTPAATIAFGSPNACNLCHKDKTPEWADNLVRTWRKRDYQASVLYRAGLIDAARKRDWTRLQDILAYLESERSDTVFTTSLIRLLGSCDDERKWPVLLKLIKDPSPLVRSAAAESLATNRTNQAAKELAQSIRDEYRLVRIRGAASLAGFPASLVQDGDRSSLTNATNEYVQSLSTRPDHWSSHYNLGNYFLSRGMLKDALTAFQTAAKLDVQGIQPLVNMSIAQARTGNLQSAEDSLGRALALDPKSAAANFNMGLLKAEQGDLSEAENCLRKALAEDPVLAEAAYNLSIILAGDRLDEALLWAEKAANLRKREPKYAYTYGFFLNTKGDLPKASEILNKVVEAHPKYPDSYILLGAIYEGQGKIDEATGLYRRGLSQEDLPEQARRFMNMKLQKISPK